MFNSIHDWMKASLPEAPRIIEIGAHIGEDTERFLQNFPRAYITVFEPDYRNRDELKRFSNKVWIHHCAVGAIDGHGTFHLSNGIQERLGKPWAQSSSLHQPTGHLKRHPEITFNHVTVVRIARLDTIFYDNNPIDFIWADVQGAEHDVIIGGRQTLARTKWFYTEFADDAQYAGQKPLSQLLEMLPDFTVEQYFDRNMILHDGNVLLRNTKIP